MRSFVYTNENGRSVEIRGGWGAFMLSRFDTGLLEGRAQTVVSPDRDGQSTYGLRRGARSVTIEGYLLAATPQEMDTLRETLCAAFDVRHTGDLLYTNHNGRYHLPCRALALPSLVADGGGGLLYKFAVTLQSDDPYFTVYPAQTVAAGLTYPNHRFPLYLPQKGTPFAVSYVDAAAHNPSDVPVHPIIEVMDTQGATVHIVNDTTGASLHILRPVGADEKMVVDTDRATVVLYRRTDTGWAEVGSVLKWLSLSSHIRDFTLAPGANVINVNEDVPTGKPITFVRYAVPAVGV